MHAPMPLGHTRGKAARVSPFRTGRVRTRAGLVAVAVATAVMTSPPAHAVPPVKGRSPETLAAVPPKRIGKRHWGRHRWIGWPRWTPPAKRSVADIVLAKARAQLGKPYVYGSAGPNSFDCSGLTQFAWAAAGVSLPHNAAAQYGSTRRVPLKDARPGDLVFSGHGGIGHVGIYIGGGRMIHAPQSGRSVEIAPLRGNAVGAGRPAAAGR